MKKMNKENATTDTNWYKDPLSHFSLSFKNTFSNFRNDVMIEIKNKK